MQLTARVWRLEEIILRVRLNPMYGEEYKKTLLLVCNLAYPHTVSSGEETAGSGSPLSMYCVRSIHEVLPRASLVLLGTGRSFLRFSMDADRRIAPGCSNCFAPYVGESMNGDAESMAEAFDRPIAPG